MANASIPPVYDVRIKIDLPNELVGVIQSHGQVDLANERLDFIQLHGQGMILILIYLPCIVSNLLLVIDSRRFSVAGKF